MAVCSEIHTKHINTAVWAERGIVNVKLAVHIVTIGTEDVNQIHRHRSTDQYSEDTTVTTLSAGDPVG